MSRVSANVDILSAEQVTAFERDGFIVLRNVIPDGDLEILRRESNRVMRRRTMKKREQKGGGTFDSFRNCLTLSDSYLTLLTHRAVLGAVVTIMGTNIRLTTSQLVFRHPDPRDRSLPVRVARWHRDMAPATEDLGHDPSTPPSDQVHVLPHGLPGAGQRLIPTGPRQQRAPVRTNHRRRRTRSAGRSRGGDRCRRLPALREPNLARRRTATAPLTSAKL